jgi:hypothetical protein
MYNLKITEEGETNVILNVERSKHVQKCMTSHPRKPKKGCCSSTSELKLSCLNVTSRFVRESKWKTPKRKAEIKIVK